jgi:hypothetical protein
MPCSCAVTHCTNIFIKNEDNHFFALPKEKNLSKIWIRACGRQKKFNPDTSRVCQNHFKKGDFENYFKIYSMNFKAKLKLKKEAFPSKKSCNCVNDENSERLKRYKRKNNRKVVQELLSQQRNEEAKENLKDKSDPVDNQVNEEDEHLDQISILKKEIDSLKSKNDCLTLENK